MSSDTPHPPLIIELTGPLRRVVGMDRLLLPACGIHNLGQLLRTLCETYPSAGSWLPLQFDESGCCQSLPPGLLIIRGSELLPGDPSHPISPGEQLTLMPMISGG
jgi:hypothetical protein